MIPVAQNLNPQGSPVPTGGISVTPPISQMQSMNQQTPAVTSSQIAEQPEQPQQPEQQTPAQQTMSTQNPTSPVDGGAIPQYLTSDQARALLQAAQQQGIDPASALKALVEQSQPKKLHESSSLD